jgi:hypothetical protein
LVSLNATAQSGERSNVAEQSPTHAISDAQKERTIINDTDDLVTTENTFWTLYVFFFKMKHDSTGFC